jgi:hypothetical protein
MDDRIIIESLDKRNVNMNMNANEIVHQQPIVKNENKSTLEVIIKKASFNKAFNYFIVIQLDGNNEKVI